MAASIKTAAIVTADSSGFSAAYSKAEGSLRSFAASAASVASGLAVVEIGTAAVKGLYAATVGLVKGGLESADAISKQAATLGVSTEALSRLAYAASFAGVSNEALNVGLRKMQDNLGNALQGNEAASKSFTDLGIDLAEFKKLDAQQQFALIADKLQGVTDPAVRATMGVNLLGKGFFDLQPLLAGGSEGLRKLGEESDKTGNTVSTVAGRKIEAANDAMDRLGKLATGVGLSLATELSPYITAASDYLFGMATSGDSVGKMVADAMETATQAVAIAADYARLLQVAWNLTQAGVGLAIADVLTNLDLLGAGTVKLLNLLPGVNIEWTSTLSDMSAALKEGAMEDVAEAKAAYDKFSDGSTSKGVSEFFAKVRQSADEAAKGADDAGRKVTEIPDQLDKAGKKVEETLERMRKAVGAFGQSKGDRAAAEVRDAGGDAAAQAEARRLAEQLEALEAQKKAQDDATAAAKKYYDDTRTPQEKYIAELEKINELVAKGLLDPETAQRAADAERAKFDKAGGAAGAGKAEKREPPALLAAGSAAAANFITEIRNRDRANDPTLQVVKRQDKTNALLADISRKLTKEPSDTEGVI